MISERELAGSIVIIDYGLGNLGSLANMLRKVGARTVVSSDPGIIDTAAKLILPGVGAFDAGIANLGERGLVPHLTSRVLEARVPILGVCLGMQLMTRLSQEGGSRGLGWLEAETIRFQFDGIPHLKVPHMGWNTIEVCQNHPLFGNLETDARFYFVHSYHVLCSDPRNVLAKTTYGIGFCSAVVKENIIGVQFHPEKSHKFGMHLLRNFVEWEYS